MIKGTKLAARIHFASGAMRVMPMTFRSRSYTSLEQVDELDEIVRDNTDIGLHTSHPQGGNAISRDPAKGVVDERFRVHGIENVFVCDASVFPSSVTVNPQLTVMAPGRLRGRRHRIAFSSSLVSAVDGSIASTLSERASKPGTPRIRTGSSST